MSDDEARPDGVSWAQHTAGSCELSAWTGALGHCLWCDVQLDGTALDPESWCSYSCRGRWRYNHVWGYARARAVRQSRGWCSRPRCRRRDVQVNHVVPLVGRGYHPGCVHHQDGLEVLCAQHHSEVTTWQLRERRGLPTAPLVQIVSEAVARLEATTYCGALTSSGRPCIRWVDPGTRCWQHVSLMLP